MKNLITPILVLRYSEDEIKEEVMYNNHKKVVDRLSELKEENIELKRINKNIRKENEQLKKDLKRCREWINSDKYDYETTLAFIKSKGYSLKDVLEYKGDVE